MTDDALKPAVSAAAAEALSAPALPIRQAQGGFNRDMGFELLSWGPDGHARTRFIALKNLRPEPEDPWRVA